MESRLHLNKHIGHSNRGPIWEGSYDDKKVCITEYEVGNLPSQEFIDLTSQQPQLERVIAVSGKQVVTQWLADDYKTFFQYIEEIGLTGQFDVSALLSAIRDAAQILNNFHDVMKQRHKHVTLNNFWIHKDGSVLLAFPHIDDKMEIISAEQNIRPSSYYRAPEIFMGESITFESDTFSFGIMLYQILAFYNLLLAKPSYLEKEIRIPPYPKLAPLHFYVFPIDKIETSMDIRIVESQLWRITRSCLTNIPTERPNSARLCELLFTVTWDLPPAKYECRQIVRPNIAEIVLYYQKYGEIVVVDVRYEHPTIIFMKKKSLNDALACSDHPFGDVRFACKGL